MTSKASVPKRSGLARLLWISILLLVVDGAWLAQLFAADKGTAPYMSPGDRHKLVVTEPAVAAKARAAGGRVVGDYGSYQVIEVDQATTQQLSKEKAVEVRDDYNLILLNASTIDTTTPEAAAIAAKAKPATGTGKTLRLVQFAGPIRPDWHDALVQSGFQVVTYIPNNAYLVYGDDTHAAAFHAKAASQASVQWESSYQGSLKIPADALNPSPKQLRGQPPTDMWAIQMVADVSANAATLQTIDLLKLEPIRKQENFKEYVNVIVRISPTRVMEVADRPDVVSIQPYRTPKMYDERQDQIIAGNLTGDQPSGPGYLAWLAGKGFSQSQFTASGFAVDVSDSGIDDGTTSPNHFGLYVGGILTNASRVIYNRIEGTANTGSTKKGCDGHGTINAHIIGGFNDRPDGFPHTDAAGFHFGLGVAPFIKMGSSIIFDPDLFTFPNFANLQSRAYRDAARISNNSWGSDVGGLYDVDAQQYDALVRDAQPAGSAVATAGNQEMVIVFANGNAGPSSGTVGSPATAKNVFSIGAAENVHPFNGCDGSFVCDDGADSANDIIDFSSRGPCADGRRKPDLVAPGTHVSGGVIQTAFPGTNGTADACFDGSGISGGTNGSNFFPDGQEFYSASSGTSHSTPAVAGACALLRQYFINQSLTPPSPAMTKAYFMNSARFLTGSGANDTLPSNSQGMGELDLGRAFDGVARVLRDQVTADKFTASGQTRKFTGTISDSSKPFRVTLAWTDAPGATSGNAFKNDLDLTVTVNGNIYKGNVFVGSTSTTGGAADTRNNVESVFIPAGVTGNFSVSVKASNINSDGVPNDVNLLDQDFALVVYNGVSASVAVMGVTSVPVNGSLGNNNGQIDFNECARINIILQNNGSVSATGISAVLSTTTPGVTILQNSSAYPDLPVDAVGTNLTPFQIVTSSNLVCGSEIHLNLSLTTSGGSLDVPLTLTVGEQTDKRLNNNTAKTIPDLTTIDSTLVASGVTTISKVKVLLYLTHTFDSDLRLSLIGPDGTTVILSDHNGGSGNNYGSSCSDNARTTFDDDASNLIGAGTPPFVGTFIPQQPLSTFIGKSGSDANGTWTLRVADTVGIDSGILFCWSLVISQFDCSDGGGACGSPTADLQLTKSDSPDPVRVGANLTYTLSVENKGNAGATGVSLTDSLPAGLSFVSVVTSQGNCNESAGTVTCDLGSLANGNIATVRIVTQTSAEGVITNTATVTSTSTDPNPANNTDSEITGVARFFTLTVGTAGDGSGSITSSPPGIVCGNDCSENFGENNTVTLTAIPLSNSFFVGWSGACGGTNPVCDVLMDTNKTATATFDKRTFTLTVSNTGGGTVFSIPSGISCGADCSEAFLPDTKVTLTALTQGGATFAGWGGDCSGTAPCELTMDAHKNVSATFTFPLVVQKSGTGNGTVTSTSGINCGGNCSQDLVANTMTTLTATPDGTSSFQGWSGACTGTAPCTVTMDAAKTVGAFFKRDTVLLTVTKTAGGNVSSDPPGINCGSDCTDKPDLGSITTLTATPVFDGVFLGWSGDCSGTEPCVVTNDVDHTVHASFGLPLRVIKVGNGTGTVTSVPHGIDCGNNCLTNFVAGTNITLFAVANIGSVFVGWGGPCSGTGPCSLTNNVAESVTATFSIGADLALTKTATTNNSGLVTYDLTITNQGPSTATGVTLLDTLPNGATVITNLFSQGSAFRTAGKITYNVGTISNGAVATATIMIQPTSGGQVCNTASLTANEFDPTSTNNIATACLDVNLPPADATPHDMAVTSIKASKRVLLTATKPTRTTKVQVTIQNRSRHDETIEDTAMLGNLAHLIVNTLGVCANPTPVLMTEIKSPVTLKSKGFFKVTFQVDFDCANDPLPAPKGSALHADYTYTATVDHAALDGKADTHPEDDICPRSVVAPGELDPNPDGTIVDKGCGNKKPNGTFGATIFTDVIMK